MIKLGIYTLDFALELIRAGADQLGMSHGEKIIREFEEVYGDGGELKIGLLSGQRWG
jgi:hypothetical protein